MTHGKFKKVWRWLRLWLILRELKKISQARPVRQSVGPLAALLLCLSCAPGKAEDPVVVILRDGLPACSGFAVGKNQILTAAHCVADRSDVAFVTADQWNHTARGFTLGRVLFTDATRDIAALSSEFNFRDVLTFREPVEGEAVFARSVFFDAMTDGNVLPGAGYFRDTTMSIDLGWSGSPVFGLDGKVVGFVHSCEAAQRGPRRVCLPYSTQIGVLP